MSERKFSGNMTGINLMDSNILRLLAADSMVDAIPELLEIPTDLTI